MIAGMKRRDIGVRSLIGLIRLYQFFSRRLPRQCRFHPTCSQYASESLMAHGLVAGVILTLKRLGRCHPFSTGGLDPVPSTDVMRCMR